MGSKLLKEKLPNNSFLVKNGICNFHEETMPIITDVDLSSILWLKCYSTHKDFPRQKLIEQSLTALEPTPTMMTTFFEMVDRLACEGGITEDEAAIIRADAYCKKELSGMIRGNADGITEETVYEIREKLKSQYIGDANRDSELNYQMYVEQKAANRQIINKAIKEIDATGKTVFESAAKNLKIAAWIIFVGVCAALLVITILSLDFASVWIPTGILSAVSFIGVIDMLLAKKSRIYRFINRLAHNQADKAKDKKKDEYEKILGEALYTDIET